jgi:hypothetical protein
VSRLVRNLVLAAAGAVILTSMAVPAMAGSRTLRFLVQVDDGCVEVYGGPREHAVVKLMASDGTVRRQVEGRTDRRGELVACGFRGTNARIQRGDTIKVRSGHVRRQVRIPTTTPTIDLAADVVSGRAPIGSQLHFWAVDGHQILDGHLKVVADPHWSFDFSADVDLTSRTPIFVSVARRGITVEGWIQTP